MASYKILIDNSTLGTLGATVTDDDIAKAGVDLDLLVASGVVESLTKPKTTEKEA
jgi:hypothetical protein